MSAAHTFAHAGKAKTCRACRTAKPLDEFYPERLGKYGRKGKCKVCYEAARGRVPSTPVAAPAKRVPPSWIIEPSGCWTWTAGLNANGYGRVFSNGSEQRAHRWLYEQHRGAIPTGRELDHLCRNRACVNPDHLEVVTSAVNTQRGLLAKLTPSDVQRIRAQRSAGRSTGRLADEYSVTEQAIRNVVEYRSWKNVA